MMTKLAFLVGLSLSLLGLAWGQPAAGTVEIGLSGTAGSIASKTEWSSPYGSGSGEQEAQSYLTLLFRPGFYLVDGLSVEPEIYWTALEDEAPAFSLSGNVSYTYRAPDAKVGPFVIVGYGLANTVPVADRALMRVSDKLDITLLNLGGGLKAFVTESAAIRIEYRYQTYWYERSETYGNFTETYKRTYYLHNIFFGFSVFF